MNFYLVSNITSELCRGYLCIYAKFEKKKEEKKIKGKDKIFKAQYIYSIMMFEK